MMSELKVGDRVEFIDSANLGDFKRHFKDGLAYNYIVIKIDLSVLMFPYTVECIETKKNDVFAGDELLLISNDKILLRISILEKELESLKSQQKITQENSRRDIVTEHFAAGATYSLDDGNLVVVVQNKPYADEYYLGGCNGNPFLLYGDLVECSIDMIEYLVEHSAVPSGVLNEF